MTYNNNDLNELNNPWDVNEEEKSEFQFSMTDGPQFPQGAVPIPISSEMRQKASRVANLCLNTDRREILRRNLLATIAVHDYLSLQGYLPDLGASDCWNPILGRTGEVADLVVSQVGRFECCEIEPGESSCSVPMEGQFGRSGYVAVELDAEERWGWLLGFMPSGNEVDPVEILNRESLHSMDEFGYLLHRLWLLWNIVQQEQESEPWDPELRGEMVALLERIYRTRSVEKRPIRAAAEIQRIELAGASREGDIPGDRELRQFFRRVFDRLEDALAMEEKGVIEEVNNKSGDRHEESLLVGDIGGTYTRLRLVLGDGRVVYERTFELRCDFESIVKGFLSEASTLPDYQHPARACFAVAGPVVGSSTTLPQRSWTLNDRGLETELGINHVTLINDFVAVCYGVLHTDLSEHIILQTGEFNPSAPIAVIGAGTGLGQGWIIPYGNNYQVFPSEGGHADFAPNSELEIELLQYLRVQFGRVSAERVISGKGIMAIYQFLHERGEFPESSVSAQIVQAIGDLKAWNPESCEAPLDSPALISEAARQQDPLSVAVMDLFVRAYAAEARNLALKLLPYGGLYIAGGIVTKNQSLFTDGTFLSTFIEGGRMSDLLKRIPVRIITTKIGLNGAIQYYASLPKTSFR